MCVFMGVETKWNWRYPLGEKELKVDINMQTLCSDLNRDMTHSGVFNQMVSKW